MGILALVLAVCALLFCVYLYLELQKKLSPLDVQKELVTFSDELKQSYGRSVKEIETEWADMYQKFSRLVGRVDKTRALEQPAPQPNPSPEWQRPPSRSDIVRSRNRGGANK